MPSAPHLDLFRRYVERLDWAIAEALRLSDAERGELDDAFDGDEARIHEELEEREPLAANPYVLGAIREHWLECARLNDSNPAQAVEPAQLVFDWLKRERPDLASILAELPYWPLGQDEYGRWI